jgi:hypothetical protein
MHARVNSTSSWLSDEAVHISMLANSLSRLSEIHNASMESVEFHAAAKQLQAVSAE